jgi:hypothetical protein
MEEMESEQSQDFGQKLGALGDDKKNDKYRDHDRYRHDPVTPAFVQETEKVLDGQTAPTPGSQPFGSINAR